MGLDAYQLANGGWKLSKENVNKILPDLKDLLSTVPPDTPVVIFCLDNSSFLGLKDEGSMSAISRFVEEDDGFHVQGALVVAPEKAMTYSLDQLKRITAECGTHPVFELTPWPRFVRTACCDDVGQVTNFNDPDFLLSILSDLTKFKFHLRKTMAPSVVVDSLELVCGSGYSQEKVAQTVNTGWAADPVHPNKHIYAKAALNVMEKMANSRPANSRSGSSQSRKRSWSASNSSDRPAGSSGGRTNCGGEGGSSGGQGGYSGGGGNGKKAQQSQQWQEMRRWNDRQDGGSYQHGSRERGSNSGGCASRWENHGPPQYPREYGGVHYRGTYRGRGGYDRHYN